MDVEELKVQEEADEQLINEAFQKLLDDYLSSRHRKKVDLITKAFDEYLLRTLARRGGRYRLYG